MNSLAIEYLADHQELVPTLAGWHWRDEGERYPLDFWVRAHAKESHGRDVPTAWVALLGRQPVGCVSLIERNMDTHPELSPWLAALFVVPEERGRGIGTSLTRRCEEQAEALGYPLLYLYTQAGQEFYLRLGWSLRSVEEYEGEMVAVMQKPLTERQPRGYLPSKMSAG
jgi:GNAT superfamily N-acetyltransferase